MLVLTRRQGESIIIGKNEIKITMLGNSGTQIKIGIEASKEIPIYREEIYNRIQAKLLKQNDDQPKD